MEGEIGASENTVLTYYLTAAEVTSKLETPFEAYAYNAAGDGTTGTPSTVD